jgi:hypothetical protein
VAARSPAGGGCATGSALASGVGEGEVLVNVDGPWSAGY